MVVDHPSPTQLSATSLADFMENDLRRILEVYRAAFDCISEAAFILDNNIPPTVLAVNQKALDLFDYPESEFVGQTTDIIHVDEDNYEFFRKHLYPSIQAHGFLTNFQHQMKTRTGRVFPSEHTVRPLLTESGDRIGWISLVSDISKHKSIENRLIDLNQQLELVVGNLPNGAVHIIDKEYRFIFNSGPELEKIGISGDELLNKSIYEVLEPSFIPNFELKLKEVFSGNPVSIERQIQGYSYIIYLSPLFNADRKVDRALALSINVTDLVAVQEKLERMNQELEEFAYVASHDLQAPLRNLENMIKVLQQDHQLDMGSETKVILDKIVILSSRMRTMIEDLLNYSMVGLADFELAWVDLNEVIAQITQNYLSDIIRSRGAKIIYESLPSFYSYDSFITNIFQNLFHNAIKYNDSDVPTILINASLKGSYWLITVQDNGIGIEEQFQKKIFGPFARGDHSRKYEGTGLGLAICKKAVQRLGGDVWVTSAVGKGSTFYVRLPNQ